MAGTFGFSSVSNDHQLRFNVPDRFSSARTGQTSPESGDNPYVVYSETHTVFNLERSLSRFRRGTVETDNFLITAPPQGWFNKLFGKNEAQVLGDAGIKRATQSEFSFKQGKNLFDAPAETLNIQKLNSYFTQRHDPRSGMPAPQVSSAGIDPNLPEEIQQKLMHFKLSIGEISAESAAQYADIRDSDNNLVEQPTKVAVQTTAMYGNFQFWMAPGIVGGSVSFKRHDDGTTNLWGGVYRQGYTDTSFHIEDPRYNRMLDDWAEDKYATRGVFKSEDYTAPGQKDLEGVKLLRNVSVHEEAISETDRFIRAAAPRSATAERLGDSNSITNEDLAKIRDELHADLDTIQQEMQNSGAMYFMGGPAMGYSETSLADNTVAGIRREQVKQTLDQINTLKKLGVKTVLHTDIDRMDIDPREKRRLLEDAYIVQTHTWVGKQAAHHNVSGLVIPNLNKESELAKRFKEDNLIPQDFDGSIVGFLNIGTARVIGSLAYELGMMVDLDTAPDAYTNAIMGSIGRVLNVGAVYRLRKDAVYQGPSGADLSSFYKPTYRDIQSGNFQELGLLPVMPNKMPADFYEYHQGISTGIYSDRYQALYGTKAKGIQGYVLSRLDSKLSAPGLGMSLNQLFRQDDLYTPGEGLAGFLASGIGRVFDTVSGHYTMQRIKKQHEGDLSGSIGEYQQKIIEQEYFRDKQQRGFFENLFNTVTTTIAETSLSMASYFGVTHAYSIAKSQIEESGSRFVVDVVTKVAEQGSDYTGVLMLDTGHRRMFSQARTLDRLARSTGAALTPAKEGLALGEYLLTVQDFAAGKNVTGAKNSLFDWYTARTGANAQALAGVEEELFKFLEDIYNRSNTNTDLKDDLISLVRKKLKSKSADDLTPEKFEATFREVLRETGITFAIDKDTHRISGSIDLARSLDNPNPGAPNIPDIVGFKNLGAVRRLDSANLANMFLPFLDNAVDIPTDKLKAGYIKAREELIDLARAKPVLRFDSSAQKDQVNRILHYGYDRLTDLARTFDSLAEYLPANPLLWIKPIRDAFNRYEVVQGKSQDDIIGNRRNFKQLIGPGFTGLLSLQGEVARTIGNIASVGVGKYVTDTLETFKLQSQASVIELKVAQSFKDTFNVLSSAQGGAANVKFDDVLQAFINKLTSPDSGISEEDVVKLKQLHIDIQTKINDTPGIKYATGHSDLGPPGDDAYAGFRKFLFSTGAVLIADRIIDHFFVKPQGLDIGDSIMSHIFGTKSPEVEGREADAKVLAGYSQNYSHSAPAILKYPAATAGYVLGGLVFPSVYHQSSHLRYWTSAKYGSQFSEDQVKLITQVASGVVNGVEGISATKNAEELTGLLKGAGSNAFWGSNKLRFGYAGAFVGASLALLATQAITSVAASTLEPLIALGDTIFRQRWHDPRKGIELDPIKGSAAAIFAKAHRQSAEKATKDMDYVSRSSMVVAGLLASAYTVSDQQPGRLFYPFATQIAAPFYQFAMVGKLDPSTNQISMQSGLQLYPLSGVGFMVPSMFNPATKYTPSVAERFLINQLTDLQPGMNQRGLIGDNSDVEQRKEAYSTLKASSGILSLALGSGLNPTFDYRPVLFIGGLTALQSAEQSLSKVVGRLDKNSPIYRELENYKGLYSLTSTGLTVTDQLTRGAYSLSFVGVNYLTHSITAFLGRGEQALFKAGPMARKLMPFYLSAMLVAGMLRPGQTTTEHQSDHMDALVGSLIKGDTTNTIKLEQNHLANYALGTAIGAAGFGGALMASGAFESVTDWANETGTGYIGRKKQEIYKAYQQHLSNNGITIEAAADSKKALMLAIKEGQSDEVVEPLLRQFRRTELPLLQSGAARLGMASRVLAPILLGSFIAAQFLSLTDFYDHSNPLSYLLRAVTDTGRGAQMTREQKAMLTNLGIRGARYQPKNVNEAIANVGDYILRSVFFMGNPSKSMGTYQDAPSPFLGIGGPLGVSAQQDMVKSYMQSQSVAADVSGSFYLMPAMASEFNNAKSIGPLLAAAQKDPNMPASRVVALYRATLMRKSRATYKNNISAGESAAISSPTLQMAIGRRSDEIRRLAWQSGEGHMLDLMTVMAGAGRIKTEATTNFISPSIATIYDYVGNNFRIESTNISGNPIRFSVQTNAEFARAMYAMAKGRSTQQDLNSLLYDSERVQDKGPNPVTGYFGGIMDYAFGTFYDRTLDEYGANYHNIVPAAALAFSAVGLTGMLAGTGITSIVQGLGALGALQVYGTLVDSSRSLGQARENVTHALRSTSFTADGDRLIKQVGSVMSELSMSGPVSDEAISALNAVFGKHNAVGSLQNFSKSLDTFSGRLAALSSDQAPQITEILNEIRSKFKESVAQLEIGYGMKGKGDAFEQMIKGIYDVTDDALVEGLTNVLRNAKGDDIRRQEIETLLQRHLQNKMEVLRQTGSFKALDKAPVNKSLVVNRSVEIPDISANSESIRNLIDTEGYSGLFKQATGGLFRASFALFDAKAGYEFISYAAAASDPMDELERRRSSYAAAASLFQTFGMIIPAQVILGTLTKNPTLAVSVMVAAVAVGSVAYANKGFRKNLTGFFKPKFKWLDKNIVRPSIRATASSLDAIGSLAPVQALLSPLRVITAGLDPMFTNMRRRAAQMPGVSFLADLFVPETKESFYDRWSERAPEQTAYGPRMWLYTRAEIEQDRKNRIESRRRRGGQLNAGITTELMSSFLQGKPTTTIIGSLTMERLTKGAGRVSSEHMGYSYVSPLTHLAVKRRQQEIDSYGNALLGPLVPKTRPSAAPWLSQATNVMRYSLFSTGSLIQAPMDVAGKSAAITIDSFIKAGEILDKVKGVVFKPIGGAGAAPNNQMFVWSATAVIGASILANKLGWSEDKDKRWHVLGLQVGAGVTGALARPYAGAAYNYIGNQDHLISKSIRQVRKINFGFISNSVVGAGIWAHKRVKAGLALATQWAKTRSWSRIAANTAYSGVAIAGATALLSPALDDMIGWIGDQEDEDDRKFLDRRRLAAIGVTAGVSLLARIGAGMKPDVAGSWAGKATGFTTKLATFGVTTLAVFKLSKVLLNSDVAGFIPKGIFNIGYAGLNLEDDSEGRTKAQAYEFASSSVAAAMAGGYAYNMIRGKDLVTQLSNAVTKNILKKSVKDQTKEVGWKAIQFNARTAIKNILTPVTLGAPYWFKGFSLTDFLRISWTNIYKSKGKWGDLARWSVDSLNKLVDSQNNNSPTRAELLAFDERELANQALKEGGSSKWGTIGSHATKLAPFVLDVATITAAHHRFAKVDPKDHMGNYKESYRAYYQAAAMTATSSVLSAFSQGENKVGLVGTLLITSQVNEIVGRNAEEWAAKDLYSGRLLTEQRQGRDSYLNKDSVAGLGALAISGIATASYYKVGWFGSSKWASVSNKVAPHILPVAQSAITTYNWQETWRQDRQQYSGTNPNYLAGQKSSDLGKQALFSGAVLALMSKTPSAGNKSLALRTLAVGTLTASAFAMDHTDRYFAKRHTLAVREAGIKDVYVKNLIQREAAEDTLGWGLIGAGAAITLSTLAVTKGKIPTSVGQAFSKGAYVLLSGATAAAATSFFGYQYSLGQGIEKYKDGISAKQWLEREKWIESGSYVPDSWKDTMQNRMQWQLQNPAAFNARNQLRKNSAGAGISLGSLNSRFITEEMTHAAQDRELNNKYGEYVTYASGIQGVAGATTYALTNFKYQAGKGITFRQHVKPSFAIPGRAVGNAAAMTAGQKVLSVLSVGAEAGTHLLPLVQYHFSAQGAQKEIEKQSNRYGAGRMSVAQYLQSTAMSRRAYSKASEGLYASYLPGSSSIFKLAMSAVGYNLVQSTVSKGFDTWEVRSERNWIKENREDLDLSSRNLARANRASKKYLTSISAPDKAVGLGALIASVAINTAFGLFTGGPVGMVQGAATSLATGVRTQSIAKTNIARHRSRNILKGEGDEYGREGMVDDLIYGVGPSGYIWAAAHVALNVGANKMFKRLRDHFSGAKGILENLSPGVSSDVSIGEEGVISPKQPSIDRDNKSGGSPKPGGGGGRPIGGGGSGGTATVTNPQAPPSVIESQASSGTVRSEAPSIPTNQVSGPMSGRNGTLTEVEVGGRTLIRKTLLESGVNKQIANTIQVEANIQKLAAETNLAPPVYGIDERSFDMGKHYGVTFDDISDDISGVEVRRAARLSMAKKLASLHSQGIVHGDVHGRNVMVRPGGETMVLDFGYSRFAEQSEAFSMFSDEVTVESVKRGDFTSVPNQDGSLGPRTVGSDLQGLMDMSGSQSDEVLQQYKKHLSDYQKWGEPLYTVADLPSDVQKQVTLTKSSDITLQKDLPKSVAPSIDVDDITSNKNRGSIGGAPQYSDPVTIMGRSGRGLVGNTIDKVKEADWQTRSTYASSSLSAGMATFNLYRGVTTLAKKDTTDFQKSYGFEYLSQSGAGYATTYLTLKGGLKATKALPYLNYAADAISLGYGAYRLNTATTAEEYQKAKEDVGGALGGLAGNVVGQGVGWVAGGLLGAAAGAAIGFFFGGIGIAAGAAVGFKIGSQVGSVVGSIAGSIYGEKVGRDWVKQNKHGASDAVEVFDFSGKYKKKKVEKEQRRVEALSRHSGGQKVAFATTNTATSSKTTTTQIVTPESSTPKNNVAGFRRGSTLSALDSSELLSPRTISNDTAKNKREDNYLKSPTLPKDIKGAEVAVTSRPLEGSKKDEDKKEEKAWYEGFFEGLAQMGRDMTNTINKAADYVGDLIGDAVGAIGSLITGDYTPNVSKEFEEAARRTSANIGIPYEYLMAVMGFETGGTFSPSERNMAGSGATGLIQFMPSTARDMFGISTDQMASMSQIEQLAYVEKYYKNVLNGRQASTLTDAYMVVLYPAAVGKGDDYTLFRSGTTAYRQNAGLDVNKDGTVTAGEATEKVKQYLPRSGDSRDASKNGPSKSYSPMSVNKGSFLDDSPKGSYDYTLSRNGKTNVEIPAPFSGVVISALPESKSGGYGEDLLIYDPSTNLTHRLAHNQRLLVKEGDTFVKGQPIAIQGSTGRSRGTHIHHEVHKGKINYAQSVGARPQMIRDRSQSRPIVEGIINEWTAGSKGGETSSAKSVNDKPKSSVRKGWITPKSTSGSDWVNSSPTSQNNIPRKIAIAAGHWNTYGQGAPGEQAWNKLVAQQIANTGKERGFEVDYIEPSKTKKMSLAEVGAALAAKESQGYYAVEIHADRNDSAGRSGVIPGSKVDAADIALAKVFGSFSKGQYSGYALPRQGVSLLETVGMAEVNKMTPEEQAKFAKEIAAMFFDALGGAEPSDTPFDPNQLYSDDVDVYKYQRPQPQRRKVTSWAERERKAQERIKSGQVKRESYQTNPSRLRNNGVRPGGRPAEPNPQAKADLDIKEIVGSNSGSKELAIVASAGGDLSGLIPQVTALAPEPQVKKQTPAKVELPREIRSREVATVAETKGSVGYGGGSGGSSGAGGQSSTVSGVVYTQGDLGSPGAFHFDIKRVEGGFYEREYLDNYVQVNGKPIGSGITVKGGEYGAPRKYGGHGGWDYAFGDKNAGLTLVNGARLISVTPTKTYGDKLIFQLPTGEQFAIIHGRATQLGRESAGAEGAYAANVPSDSGGGGQMMMRRQPPRRKVTSWAERERRALERIQSGQVVRQSYRTNSSRIAKNNQQSKEDDKGLFGFIQIPNLFKRNTTLPSKPTKDDNQSFTPPVGKKLDIKSQVSQKDIVKAIPTNSKDLDVDEILDIKVSQASDAAMSKAEVVGNVIAEAAAKAHKQKKESTPEKAVKHITNVQRPAETAQNVSSYTRSITSNITRATKTQPVYQPDNDQNVILVSSQIDQTMVNVNVANSGMRSPCSGQMAGKKQRVQGPCVA